MRNASALETFRRHRWIILATLVAFVATTAIVSKSLTKVYQTEASLLVAVTADAQSFDTVQAGQSFARSYSEIIQSRNMAERVVAELDDGTSADEIIGATSFEPLSETQLLQITAEDPDPARAQLIANTYAEVFETFAAAMLEPTTQAEVTVADPAPLATSPARPKPTLYTLIAGMLGLAIGLGLAFLREQFDRRIRNVEEVEASFEPPIVGRVPVRGRTGSANEVFAEAFRMLRTNLQFVRAGAGLRSVAITSGRAGEGKTTVVASLARAAAEVGVKVVVVEGDMRIPKLQQELLPAASDPLWPGLSNYLVEAAELDEVIHPAAEPNLYLVPAGPPPPSPSSLLDVKRGSGLVAGLLERADLVIFDTPPISVGADAAIVAKWTDGVLIMVDLTKSTHHGVSNALKQVHAVHARPLGFVVNRDRSAVGGGYGYYQDGYGDAAPNQNGTDTPGRTVPPEAERIG